MNLLVEKLSISTSFRLLIIASILFLTSSCDSNEVKVCKLIEQSIELSSDDSFSLENFEKIVKLDEKILSVLKKTKNYELVEGLEGKYIYKGDRKIWTVDKLNYEELTRIYDCSNILTKP